jgi:hypothetical protein
MDASGLPSSLPFTPAAGAVRVRALPDGASAPERLSTTAARAAGVTDSLDLRSAVVKTRVQGLVAAKVSGGVEFAGERPRASGPAIPMYAKPADANAAAVRIDVQSRLSAGARIDVTG